MDGKACRAFFSYARTCYADPSEISELLQNLVINSGGSDAGEDRDQPDAQVPIRIVRVIRVNSIAPNCLSFSLSLSHTHTLSLSLSQASTPIHFYTLQRGY